MSEAQGCPYSSFLDRRLLGDLDADERALLREHVTVCSDCSAELAQASYLESLLLGVFSDIGDGAGRTRDSVLRHIRIERARKFRWSRVLALSQIAALFLIAMLFVAYRSAAKLHRDAKANLAATEIKAMEKGLERYHEDHAAYPRSGNPNLVEALAMKRRDRQERSYGSLRPEALRDATYLDPWGTPYVYLNEDGQIRIYSCGENGEDDRGAGDDVVAALP